MQVWFHVVGLDERLEQPAEHVPDLGRALKEELGGCDEHLHANFRCLCDNVVDERLQYVWSLFEYLAKFAKDPDACSLALWLRRSGKGPWQYRNDIPCPSLETSSAIV